MSARHLPMKVSIIIPALNEATHIERTLRAASTQQGPHEIIVVDGGSDDDTPTRAAPFSRVLSSPRGRAHQMNHGAAHATGEVLLFLHADTLLPDGALEAVQRSLSKPHVEAGAFRLRFDANTLLYRFYGWCTRLHMPRICFGDRGLFVRRTVFDELGGFPEVPIFEDLEMVRLLHARGGFRFLSEAVITSARRFEADGPLRQQLRNTYLWLRYILGTDPHKVAHLYAYSSKARHEPI